MRLPRRLCRLAMTWDGTDVSVPYGENKKLHFYERE